MAIGVETVDGRIRILTLDRPDVLNATRVADLDELDGRLSEAEADPEIRCVVLTGAGPAFCAGHDIHEMDGLDAAALAELDRRRHGPTWHWATAAVPTIVAVNGVCYGFGAILAAGADLRVGGPATRIKVTAVAYGGVNLTWSLPALIGESHARDLILTARAVDGPEAFRIGLLNRYAEDGEVLTAAIELARTVAAHPAPGPRRAKRLLNEQQGASTRGPLRARARRATAVAPRRRWRRHLRRLPAARRRTARPATLRPAAGRYRRRDQTASAAAVVIWPASTSGPRTR